MSSDWLFVSQGVWTVHPLALRVALSPCKSLSNSPALAEGETLPLSNIDSEVGQEPRGWELGCSHRGASRPLEAEAEKTVSRIGVRPLKTDVLLTEQWHVTNVQPNMDIYDCGVRRNFQDPRNFLRIWCNCMKQIFLSTKYFICVGMLVLFFSTPKSQNALQVSLTCLGLQPHNYPNFLGSAVGGDFVS